MATQKGILFIQFKKNKRGNFRPNRCVVDETYNLTNIIKDYLNSRISAVIKDRIAVELIEEIEAADKTAPQTWAVEYEVRDNQVYKLRLENHNWEGEEVKNAPTIPIRNRPDHQPKTVNPSYFHNPYNFVPALSRNSVKGELGDCKPVGHGRYLPDHWSGRISVKLTTVTPLLIPDASKMQETDKGHKTFPVRIGVDGKPYLPATSIKGMLRSAYEAITNSRMGVLEKHDELLAFRMPAKTGIEMVPARIENGAIALYTGTSQPSEDGKPQHGDPMYAAWLHRWDRNGTGEARNAKKYEATNISPGHKERVQFWAEKFSKGRFQYWKVQKIVPYGDQLGGQPNPTLPNRKGSHQPMGEPLRKFEGYVCITNKNIKNKHDERVFFTSEEPIRVPLTQEVKRRWQKLIASYQNNDEFKKGLQCPSALQKTAHWSRQVVGGDEEQTLSEGTLCYARIEKNGSDYEVFDLFPVMISRGLYDYAPAEILCQSLKPAESYKALSPADRVFGWVNAKGKGAYKGQIRVHSVVCRSDDAIDNFGSEDASVPLAILGKPKTEQARFYCADDDLGNPLENGVDKDIGYSDDEQSLRGRKVYPHHAGLPEKYWTKPVEDRTQKGDRGHCQEYRMPKDEGIEQRGDQNRSITEWVRPETEFEFDIDVTNLSPVELGALLWSLSSPDIHYHRLGGGKPLGFGSVWMEVNWDQTDLRLGNDWIDFYRSLVGDSETTADALACIDEYQKAVVQAYGNMNRFEQLPFISAFCRCSKGYEDDTAIHYPRSTEKPLPNGEAFDWFVQNENTPKGLKLALPTLNSNQKLPISPQ